MDKEEAKKILRKELNFYKQWPYSYLADLVGQTEHTQILSDTGIEYQLEIEFLWDNEPEGNVRILGAIDDGGWRAFFPLCDSFIIKPDGTFVSE